MVLFMRKISYRDFFFFSLEEKEIELKNTNEKIAFVIEEFEQNVTSYVEKLKAMDEE